MESAKKKIKIQVAGDLSQNEFLARIPRLRTAGVAAPWGCNIKTRTRAREMKTSLSLLVEDIMLERVKVTVSKSITIQQALEAGVLIGGAEFVASPELRVMAQDTLEEFGIEWTRNSHRHALRSGPTPSARSAAPAHNAHPSDL